MSRSTVIPCFLAVVGGASTAVAAPPELLPEMSLRLQAARYRPTAPDLHWDTWIGAGVGLVRFDRTTVAFQGDVETTAGNTRRAFDASQVNYHLEPAIRVALRKDREATLFYHHVSRHEIDRPKVQAVDWNVLGVRASAPLPSALRVDGRATLSLGHTTQQALVGYRWEILGQVEATPRRRSRGAPYAVTRLRVVTADRSAALPRDGFTDFVLEGGARWGRAAQTLQVFVAYEHRNDVLIQQPGAKDRALLGFRIGLRSATPAPGP